MSELKKLTFQPTIDAEVITILDKLVAGDLTLPQLHNRKAYFKRKKNICQVLKLTIACELYKAGIYE
jgi:hypothetical protein